MDYSWVIPENIIDRLDSLPYKRVYIDNLKRLKKHKTQKLFKICDSVKCGPFGSTVLAETYSNEGVLYIRPVNISNNLFDESDLVFLDRLDVRKKNLDIFTNNDLFFGRVGNPCVSKVSKEYSEITISPNIIGVKVGDKIDSDYLWMFLSSRYGIFQIERMLKTVAQPTTSTETIKELDVLVPLPEIQKYIGDKVRKAEELREEAKKLKKEAEGIIYKELNFGSLEDKLKIINNKYTWVGLHNLGIRIDSKYYNEKVLRIKDYFNKHYETIKLKECLQYCSRGKSFAESSEDGIILIKTKNLNNSFINYERNFVYEKEVNNNLILKEKDLIFASMGVGSLGKIDMYYPSEEKATIDGTLMLLRFKSDSKLKPEYVMEFLRTHIGQKLIYQNVVGSTGIISISVDDLINIDIPYIDDEKQEKISNFTNKYLTDIYASKRLIQEAKQDVEDLIEGDFDMSKVKANS